MTNKNKADLDKRPIIAVTMGDPAGIGPEIIIKALSTAEINRLCRPVVIGDASVMKNAMKVAKVSPLVLNEIKRIDNGNFQAGMINILDMDNVEVSKLKIGKISAEAGRAAIKYVERAVDLALEGKVHAIATAPINKEAVHKAGYKFDGHTELLAKKTGTTNYAMMFLSDSIRVALVTTHIPLSQVPKELDKKKILNLIKLVDKELHRLLGKSPKIGVAGLNPHAGEGGIFGQEEEKIIRPAVEEAKKLGIDVKGPISADAIFYLANIGMFDIVVAMYHDQGLIPLKLLSFNRSVNVTIGLPIIRTSVDHGTGFDIAGKGWANPGSMVQAIKVATMMVLKKKE
ncbi:MAG: 4-hydroxythreonine-4-phosphate dehydrogenase PdxA [Candidatus Saganbacteria bacterium]|nr:4-hydroxythreonine-4-phosphate dehydrogenase PdxA [Candidatus Saganbacteria bacterium]